MSRPPYLARMRRSSTRQPTANPIPSAMSTVANITSQDGRDGMTGLSSKRGGACEALSVDIDVGESASGGGARTAVGDGAGGGGGAAAAAGALLCLAAALAAAVAVAAV